MAFRLEGPSLLLSPADCAAVRDTVGRRLRQIRETNTGDTADEARVLSLLLEYAARGMSRGISSAFPSPHARPFPVAGRSPEMHGDSSRKGVVVVGEAARRLGLVEQTGRRVRQLIAAHELVAEMVDGRWMVDEGSLDALVAKRKRHR